MTNETDYRGKMRAVFLAAIMLTSIVGGTVALTGSAAAVTAPSNGEVNYESSIAFQGQNIIGEFNSNDASIGDDAVLRKVDSYNKDTIESSSFVEQIDIESDLDGDGDSAPTFEVDTDDLEASDYIVVVDGNSNINLTRSNTFEVTVQDLSAEFDEDDLPVQVDSFEDSTAELDVSSARGAYSYNVSAGGDLERDELFNIFASEALNGTPANVDSNGTDDGTWLVGDDGSLTVEDSSGNVLNDGNSSAELSYDSPWNALQNADEISFGPFASYGDTTPSNPVQDLETSHDGDVLTGAPDEGYFTAGEWTIGLYNEDADDYDEKIIITSSDTESDVSFVGVDENDYTFDFDVTDTEATASADASLIEQDLSASFDSGVSQTAAGDIAEFTVELEDTDETWVQIGGEDSDFVDVLYLEADDEDESMTVQINTRTLGTDVGLNDVYDEGDNVETIESEMHSSSITAPSGAALYEDDGTVQSSFEDYLDSQEIIDTSSGVNEDTDDQLTRPLQPTDYEITVAGTDVDDALFDADAGGEANDELASMVLELQQL